MIRKQNRQLKKKGSKNVPGINFCQRFRNLISLKNHHADSFGEVKLVWTFFNIYKLDIY